MIASSSQAVLARLAKEAQLPMGWRSGSWPWKWWILLDRLLEHAGHPRHIDDVDLESSTTRLLHGGCGVAAHQTEQA